MGLPRRANRPICATANVRKTTDHPPASRSQIGYAALTKRYDRCRVQRDGCHTVTRGQNAMKHAVSRRAMFAGAAFSLLGAAVTGRAQTPPKAAAITLP